MNQADPNDADLTQDSDPAGETDASDMESQEVVEAEASDTEEDQNGLLDGCGCVDQAGGSA